MSFTVTTTLKDNATIDKAAVETVADGADLTIGITAGTGYIVTAYKVDDTWYEEQVSSIVLGNIRANRTVNIVAQQASTLHGAVPSGATLKAIDLPYDYHDEYDFVKQSSIMNGSEATRC